MVGKRERWMAAAPTVGDRRRQLKARSIARQRFDAVDEQARGAIRQAFREELGATVRCASPVLIALLAAEGLSLDDAVTLLDPHPGWPRRPRLGGTSSKHASQHTFRHYVAAYLPRGRVFPPMTDDGHCHLIERTEGGWLRIEVVGHSVEVEAEIGPVCFATRFGELRIELDRAMPETLADACVGRPLEDVVDHAVLRGRGWTIGRIEAPRYSYGGQNLVIETGVVPVRMPWSPTAGGSNL